MQNFLRRPTMLGSIFGSIMTHQKCPDTSIILNSTPDRVINPEVLVSPDLKLSMEDYQWLSDIGVTMTERP